MQIHCMPLVIAAELVDHPEADDTINANGFRSKSVPCSWSGATTRRCSLCCCTAALVCRCCSLRLQNVAQELLMRSMLLHPLANFDQQHTKILLLRLRRS